MALATVSKKGWIVIPKVYRQKYDIKPGDRVRIVDYGGGLSVVPIPDDPISALHGIFADELEPSLTDDLLTERQREKEREGERIERFASD